MRTLFAMALCLAAALPGNAFITCSPATRARFERKSVAQLYMTAAVKRVLVTGANKGIGLATVEKLLCDYPEVRRMCMPEVAGARIVFPFR